MLQVLMGLVGVLGILVSVAGAVACAFAIGRTRWAIVLLAGFAGEAVTGIFYRIMPTLFSYTGGSYAGASWQLPYLLGSVLGLAAHAAVVAGVAGLLFEARRPA
jgi:hypothetical protein